MTARRPFVLDASVAVAIVRGEDGSEDHRAALDERIRRGERVLVPEMFWLEVVNALLRRHRWPADDVVRALEVLDGLELETVATERLAVLLALDLACEQDLSAYDAAYLALAAIEEADLLTLDDRLARAAGAGGDDLGERRARETLVVYSGRERPSWAAHGRFLGELRRRAEVSA
jgi:predicted nucleic acid-binding protein